MMTQRVEITTPIGNLLHLSFNETLVFGRNKHDIGDVKTVSREHTSLCFTSKNKLLITTLSTTGNTLIMKNNSNTSTILPPNQSMELSEGDKFAIVLRPKKKYYIITSVPTFMKRSKNDSNDDEDDEEEDLDEATVVATTTNENKKSYERSASFLQPTETLIDLSEIHFIKVIGTGSCGEVWKAEWNQTIVAVKKIYRSLISESVLSEFLSEAKILSKLRHPNIVLIWGIVIEENTKCIITEYMSRGSLSDILQNSEITIDKDLFFKFAINAAQGINYLHTQKPPIIHRDIKSMNFLVTDDFRVKVSDFGMAKLMNHARAQTVCGTLPWLAPEIISQKPYSLKADVYSFGIFLWELMCRQIPYESIPQPLIIKQVAEGKLRPPIPANCPPAFAKLLERTWHNDPDQRPSMKEVLDSLISLSNPPSTPRSTFQSNNAGYGRDDGNDHHQHNSPSSSSMNAQNEMILTMGANNINQLQNIPSNRSPPISKIIDFKSIQFVQKICNTKHSATFTGLYNEKKSIIKIYDENKIDKTKFERKLSILCGYDKPSVSRFLGGSTAPHLFVVYEFIEGVSLLDLMKSNLEFTWKLVMKLALEIAILIHSLHEDSIIHANLKSSNLIVQIEDSKIKAVKITDFLFPSMNENDPSYSFNTDNQSKQDNLVLFGVILWEMGNRLITASYSPPTQNLSLPQSSGCLELYVEILKLCFSQSSLEFVDLIPCLEQLYSRIT